MLQNPTFHITVFEEPPKLIYWFILLKRKTEAPVTTRLLKGKCCFQESDVVYSCKMPTF